MLHRRQASPPLKKSCDSCVRPATPHLAFHNIFHPSLFISSTDTRCTHTIDPKHNMHCSVQCDRTRNPAPKHGKRKRCLQSLGADKVPWEFDTRATTWCLQRSKGGRGETHLEQGISFGFPRDLSFGKPRELPFIPSSRETSLVHAGRNDFMCPPNSFQWLVPYTFKKMSYRNDSLSRSLADGITMTSDGGMSKSSPLWCIRAGPSFVANDLRLFTIEL